MFETEVFKGHVLIVIEAKPKGAKFGGIMFGLSKAKAILAQRDNLSAFLRGAEIDGQTWEYKGKRCFKVNVFNAKPLSKGEKFWKAVHAKLAQIEAYVKEYDNGQTITDVDEAA